MTLKLIHLEMFYVTGRTQVNSSYYDFATIKYNASGVREWIAIYDNSPVSQDDCGYDLELTNPEIFTLWGTVGLPEPT